MTPPFPFGAVIARLRESVSQLRLVGNAADLETALDGNPNAVPAGFVVGHEEGDKPAGASGGVQIQKIRSVIVVVLMVRNFSNTERGGGARGEMDTLVAAVDEALKNWRPDEAYAPIYFRSGRDERFKTGLLSHQRIFESSHRSQTNSQA